MILNFSKTKKDAEKDKFWDEDIHFHESALMPSEILSWYEKNLRLKSQGLKNEIDINEIREASYGVRNGWTDRYRKNPEKFIPVLENRTYDWKEICK